MATTTKRLALLAALVFGGALACSGDPTAAPGNNLPSTPARNGAPGGDTSGGSTLAISPRVLTMTVGATGHLVAVSPNGTIITNQVTWRSSNSTIAAAGDAGAVTGRAAGTVFVYGTFEGHTDSAAVTVAGTTP